MKNTGVRELVVPQGQRRLDTRVVHEARHVLREEGLLSG